MKRWLSVIGYRPNIEHRTSNAKSAFTFVELLIVVTIFSLLSLALYATFASGMRVWGRVQDATFSRKRVILRMEKISQDLRQALNFPKVGFSAEDHRITFPVLSSNDEILKVTYYFEDGALFQKHERFKEPKLQEDEEEEGVEVKPRKLLSGVKELKFEFAYQGISIDKYEWRDAWNKSYGLPIAVKMEIKAKDADLTKTVVIPVS